MKRSFVFLTTLTLVLYSFVFVALAQESPLPSPVPTVAPVPLPDPPLSEDMTTENILTWVLSGGCGFLAFFIIEKLAGAWFHGQTPEVKQYLASGISGGLAALALVGLVALGAKDNPGEVMAWVDAILPVFFTGAGFANLTHARLVLSSKSEG